MSEQNPNGEEPVIRDKRKIDPETGEARAARACDRLELVEDALRAPAR